MTTTDKEMREAFCQWLVDYQGIKPSEVDVIAKGSHPALYKGFQAAYQLQQRRVEELESELEYVQGGLAILCGSIQNKLTKEKL